MSGALLGRVSMELPLPPIAFDATLVPFAMVALSMIGVTIFLLGKVLPADGRPPLVTQMLLALSVLAGGSLLLLALLFVFLNPNGTDSWTWVLLSFNFMMMFPAGIWFVGLIAFRDRRIATDGWLWPAAISLATTGSEATMGVLFVVGVSTAPASGLLALSQGLSSVWFFGSMAAVMAALVLWAPLSRIERRALTALTLSAVVAPWVTAFPTIGGGAMGALMAVVFLLLLRPLLRGEVAPSEVGLLFGLAGAFLASAVAGLAVAVSSGTPTADLGFGATMGIVMAVEIAYLCRRFYHGASFLPSLARAGSSRPEPEWAAGRPSPTLER
jgi:hypothetical protein